MGTRKGKGEKEREGDILENIEIAKLFASLRLNVKISALCMSAHEAVLAEVSKKGLFFPCVVGNI